MTVVALQELVTRQELITDIHRLAQELGLITAASRDEYERALATFFGKTSSTELSETEVVQFHRILCGWSRARAVVRENDKQVA